MRLWGCSIAALMVGATPVLAQTQMQDQTPSIGTVPQGTPRPSGEVETMDAPEVQNGGSAPAQTAPAAPAAAEEEVVEEVVVTGQQEGAVRGAQPEQQLGPAEISSYGASNVTELLDMLSAQLGSEPPVILIGGRRASLFEVRSYPTEAFARMDILSEDVALRYGYSANQKVVNFVFRRFYRALTAEFNGLASAEGGYAGARASENLAMIMNGRRLNVDANYWQTSTLLESERGVSRDAGTTPYALAGNVVGLTNGLEIDPALSALAGSTVTVAGVPGAAASGPQGLAAFAGTDPNATDNRSFRTLRGPQKNLSLSALYFMPLTETIDATLNLDYSARESESLQGLPTLALRLPTGSPFSPFTQDVRLVRYFDGIGAQEGRSTGQNFTADLAVRGDEAPWAESWRWSVNANYRRNTSQQFNERGVNATLLQEQIDANNPAVNPFAPLELGLLTLRPDDTSRGRNTQGSIDAQTNGTLFSLPTGDVRVNLRAQGQTEHQTSVSTRSGVVTPSNTSRDSGSVRGGIDVPIASTTSDFLAGLGEVRLTGNVELQQVSNFGQLTSFDYGFNWRPIRGVRFNLNWQQESEAPSANQLGAPQVITPNVRAFDFIRGESVDITSITGGNPALRASDERRFRAQANFSPITIERGALNLNATYTSRRVFNDTGGLPSITAEVQEAFSDRFVRDTTGRLISVDSRAVNFERSERKDLQLQLSFFKSFASPSLQRRQERFQAFRRAEAQSRRSGEPLPAEFAAQAEEFRRMSQQQSLFGNRGPGGGQRQSGGPGQNRPQGQGAGTASAPQGQAAAPARGSGQGPGGSRVGGPGAGGFRGPGGPGGPGGGAGNSVRFNLTHLWVMQDEVVIREGLPILDRLNGATGSTRIGFNAPGSGDDSWGARGGSGNGGGGTPKHQIRAQTGLSYESYLLDLDTVWYSSTFVNTGALGSTTRLNFSDIARVNLTGQIDFNRQFTTISKIPFLRGARLSLKVENVFNARPEVTDQTGVTPNNYDPRLLDPIGRLVRLTFRKQFN